VRKRWGLKHPGWQSAGHYRAFISLLRNAPSWEAATKVYRNITSVPVQLVWGDKDWAKQSEREYDSQLIPQAETATIGIYAIGPSIRRKAACSASGYHMHRSGGDTDENGGHFLPLDQPSALVDQIRDRFTVGEGLHD